MGKEITLRHKGKVGECPINEFDIASMNDDAAIVMIAKRRSGKSWVVRAILYYYSNRIPTGIVISKTERMSSFYSKIVPDTYIYYDYQSETIGRLLSRQTDIIKKAKEKKKLGKNVNTKAFIVMDDCLSSKGEWAKDQSISELLFNGRHYHVMYILTMQFPLGIKPELRCNFDYIFLLADDGIGNQKRIFEHYAGIFPNFEAFRQVFGELTKDHGCMVIENSGCGNNFLDKIYYYKAPDLSDITMMIGSSQYKKFHTDNYDAKWAENQMKNGVTFDRKLFDRREIQKNPLIVNKIKNNKY